MKSLSLPLAQGRTAEIYAWDDRHILKLYRDWCPSDWVEYEARIARAVHSAGIPSPAAGEIVSVDGRRGLVYERIEGVSMLEELNARPWRLVQQARALAELQAKIHELVIDGLPSYHERLEYDIRKAEALTGEQKNMLQALLGILPAGRQLCHGDFHPGNVIVTPNGPIVIDWMTACSGSLWADVARSSLLLSIGAKGAGKLVSPPVRILIRFYHRTYLHRYQTLHPDTGNELERWIPLIAAARLNENIIPERSALIRIVDEGLSNETS